MNKFFTLCFALTLCTTAFAQTAVVSGTVTDEKDKSKMIGVNIRLKGTNEGTTTDDDGSYSLEVPAAKPFALEFTYTGYQTRTVDFVGLKQDERKTQNLLMSETSKDLDIVVVSTSRVEKPLGQQTISMEVLKGQNITQSAQTLNEAMNKVPGVNMMGKTISIRGGSGFSDATSNRVMVNLDDVPILNPDNGGINWLASPTEAINQTEIVKGASSVTTGASALNGVIDIRTITPTIDKPFNKLYLSVGLYDQFHNKDFDWFLRNSKGHYKPPVFGGVSFVHASKIKNVDLTFDFGYNGDQGYMQKQKSQRGRGFVRVKYTPSKMPNLAVGFSALGYYENGDDFFMWENYDLQNAPPSVPRQGDSAVLVTAYHNTYNSMNVTVMPFLNYFDKHDNKHAIKLAYYHVEGYNTAGDSSKSNKIWGEYAFSKQYKPIELSLTTGVAGYYAQTPGKTFGKRYQGNASAFVQVEKRFFKRLTISGGVRLEFNKLDTTSPMNPQWLLNEIAGKSGSKSIQSPIQPLARVGLNYQAAEGTFLRASFGMGFRYPSFAEKYIKTARSGVYVVPNFNLRPEAGWSAEVGVKQAVKVSKWIFYADVAAFVSKYRDLIQFVPVTPEPSMNIPPYYLTNAFLVAQTVNVSRSLIYGAEVSAIGTGKIYGVPLNFLLGYTYMEPLNLDHMHDANPTKWRDDKYLIFRNKHTAKLDIQAEPKNIIVGATLTYVSSIMNLGDYGKIASITRWMDAHSWGSCILNLRLGYNWKDRITATAIVKNVANSEYILRPAFVEPPRSYTLLVTYQFSGVKKKQQN